MTTTKTPEQSQRVQLDILNELADVRARLAAAERAKAEAVAAERARCALIAESCGEPFVTHGITPQSEGAREAREWIAAVIRAGREPDMELQHLLPAEGDRAVAVTPDGHFPDKVALSLTADAGHYTQIDTLRMTRSEALRAYGVLGNYLSGSPAAEPDVEGSDR